ncbi:hypothetical protein SHOU24_49 [Vibrio phage SHOU24]|nr:hypothetical protein SHOU24_49 [Vibrio phage SHOU24]AHI61246.1 hypothetical protein SHOU24_49 [Vibrio phage SHOU24]
MKPETYLTIAAVATISAILFFVAKEYADCSGQLVRSALWFTCIL